MGIDSPPGVRTPALHQESGDGRDDAGAAAGGVDPASWRRLFRYACSLVGDEAEAEDLTQETFAELFRAQAAGKPVQWVGAWMRTVTRRLAYKRYREQRPDLHTSFDITTEDGRQLSWEPPDTQPSPEDRVIELSMVRMSARVLRELSDRERACVLMYLRGSEFSEIASTLGVSRWTARRLTLDLIRRVRSRLRHR